MNPKRLISFASVLAILVVLPPQDAAAQRGRPSGGHPSPPPASTGRAVPRSSVPGNYRPYYGGYSYYRPYYYHPAYYYSPLFYGYSPFYFGLAFSYGYYPYYASYGYGYGCCGAYYGAGYGPYYGGGPYYAGGPYYGPGPYPYYWYRGSWASARVEVKPRDAQVFIDGYFVGVVDQFDGVLQRLDVPAGEHELSIYMPGYHTMVEKTLFRPGEGYHFRGALEPLPPGAPAEPKPIPVSRPSGEGDPNGPPPENAPYRNDPYRPPPPERGRTQPPMQRPDRPNTDMRVERGGFGTLNLRVQPGDAVVQIDGERWDSPEGGSRLSVELAAGQHRIEVRKEGFRPYVTTIQIRPGESQALNVSLPGGGA